MIVDVLYLALVVVALVAIEYLVHRLIQHHPCPGPLARSYDLHAVQHHRQKRVDVNVDAPAWWYGLLGVPLWAPPLCVGRWGLALAVLVLIGGYAALWTGLHRAIHGLGGKWATWLPFYPALRAHHLTHHQRPGRNYGAVFGPLLDRPLGTWSRPTTRNNDEVTRS
jgi:sterol desaturase/sphingolipid hydroxylase (fatty acid hydroxylase superfamily)